MFMVDLENCDLEILKNIEKLIFDLHRPFSFLLNVAIG